VSQELPVACTLDGRSLAARQSDLRISILAEAVTAERLADGYRWQFRSQDALFARLGAVIDAERQCCRFLRFQLRADSDEGLVTLDVTGPAGTAEFLESWVTASS
jgi:hypothetical protein